MSTAYPPSPRTVPTSLGRTTPGYVLRVVLMLLGLLAFVALYLAIPIGLGWLLLQLWSLPISGRGAVYLMLGGTAVLVVPIVFLIKGLFYRDRTHTDGLVEVTREEQPALFSFLDALIAETGAPTPRRVYLSPDVDAAVFYEPSLLSLIWPTQKNLLIGLGLVNHLTRSELKAVLGHELGHFSQRAMKVGSYVYVANRVVSNLVMGRDAFDDMLESGKRSDVRIALVAYLASGVVGSMRLVLRGAFEILTLGHRSLSREMEFAADRAAIAVAGSDAIARGLFKAEVADACYGTSLRRLSHAADQGLVTDDFYVHQTRALDDVRRVLREPAFGDAQQRHDGFLFRPDAVTKPSMWSTHPPSADRERAARSHGVEAEHDEGSAWTLFTEPASLRQRLTTELVRLRIPHAKGFPKEAAEIEALFDDERAAEARVDRYGVMYTGRPLKKLDLKAIFARTPRPREALAAAYAGLYGEQVSTLSESYRRLQREASLLQQSRAATKLVASHLSEMQAIDEQFGAMDVEVAHVHAEMAIELGEKHAKKLRWAYAEPARLARWTQGLQVAQGAALAALRAAKGSEAAARTMIERLETLDATTAEVLGEAKERRAPKLPNVNRDHSMAQYLLGTRVAGPFQNDGDAGAWIQSVLGQSAEVLDKLGRLHAHAIASLLAEHEAVHTAWATARDGDPAEQGTAEQGTHDADG